MSQPPKMSAETIIEVYKDGDEIGWPAELQFLWTEHRNKTLALLDSVVANGFRDPVLLGSDKRIWDGHHRIAVALALQIPVPVKFALTQPEAPPADPITFADTCCGKCSFGTCYVDQMTGA